MSSAVKRLRPRHQGRTAVVRGCPSAQGYAKRQIASARGFNGRREEKAIPIIAPRRSNSAHFHRPWRATLRRDTLQQPSGVHSCANSATNWLPSKWQDKYRISRPKQPRRNTRRTGESAAHRSAFVRDDGPQDAGGAVGTAAAFGDATHHPAPDLAAGSAKIGARVILKRPRYSLKQAM
jgi:hypothetical protein